MYLFIYVIIESAQEYELKERDLRPAQPDAAQYNHNIQTNMALQRHIICYRVTLLLYALPRICYILYTLPRYALHCYIIIISSSSSIIIIMRYRAILYVTRAEGAGPVTRREYNKSGHVRQVALDKERHPMHGKGRQFREPTLGHVGFAWGAETPF